LRNQLPGKRVVVIFQRNSHFLDQRKTAESRSDRMTLATIQVDTGKRNSRFFFWKCISPGSSPNTPVLPEMRRITPIIIRQAPKAIRVLASGWYMVAVR
jgi:hypothetical protein